MAEHFKDLFAWQKAMEFVNVVEPRAGNFSSARNLQPNEPNWTNWVSISSNIAEGQARYSSPEFRHFLRHSRGSLAELETQILIAPRRCQLPDATPADLLKRCGSQSDIQRRIGSIKETER